MTEPTEQLSEDLKGVTLSPAEHAAIRGQLLAFVHRTPERLPMPAFVFRHAAAFSLAAFVLLATATTTLAGHSLPGDFLYPVRLAVNDRFSVALAGDEDARLDREVDQMERTLDEEELVASEELASLALEGGADVRIGDEYEELSADADLEIDVESDAEIRALERLLDQEESAAELELSL